MCCAMQDTRCLQKFCKGFSSGQRCHRSAQGTNKQGELIQLLLRAVDNKLCSGHAGKLTYIGFNLQTATSMQDQVRSAAEAYTKPAEQPTQQSTAEQAQSPASDSTSGPNSATATSSQQQEQEQQQQQQQQASQKTSASSSKEGPEMRSQAESTARHGHTSTSSNSNQQSGSNQKAKEAKSEGKTEGLMYRLRSIREAVRKEVQLFTPLSCILLLTPFTL